MTRQEFIAYVEHEQEALRGLRLIATTLLTLLMTVGIVTIVTNIQDIVRMHKTQHEHSIV